MATTERKPLNLVLGAGNVSSRAIPPFPFHQPVLNKRWEEVKAHPTQVGDTSIDPSARFDTPEQVNGFLNAFLERGYHQIDTARGYSPSAPGTSEPRLGAVAAGARSTIDTKVMSRDPGSHSKAKILDEVDISLEALQIKQINILYLHAPDRATPFEEACEAMDQAHRDGKIKKWGLSNYTADEVQKFLDICEARGWVKPSVYQGHYNAIVRSNEKHLFPVLRKHGLSFYAYSPAGGGFFAGNHNNTAPGGRFDKSVCCINLHFGFFLSHLTWAMSFTALCGRHVQGVVRHARHHGGRRQGGRGGCPARHRRPCRGAPLDGAPQHSERRARRLGHRGCQQRGAAEVQPRHD